MTPMKPFEEQDVLEKLKNRSDIRRKIGRTSDGKPDRIADTCEAAYAEIVRLREELDTAYKLIDDLAAENSKLLTAMGW